MSVCKGRLEHLRQSLPAMLAQPHSEVIVVDYDCPDRAADWVEIHYPAARTIRISGDAGFSNWQGRNAGARIANGEFLLFCDADTVLVAGATTRLAQALSSNGFGFFRNADSMQTRRRASLAGNDLKGFLAVPRQAFAAARGYDEWLGGYASGADTDLENRLRLMGLHGIPLDPSVVERVIAHGDAERLRFHSEPVAQSFLIGRLHSALKLALMRFRKRPALQPDTIKHLHALSTKGASAFLQNHQTTVVRIPLSHQYLQMLEMLGRSAPRLEMFLEVRIVPSDDEKPV